MHALIPRRYIVHTHHVYANVFLTAEEGERMLSECGIDFGWIPTSVPGMQLAQEIAKAYPENNAPKILFLENHGIVVSDDEPERLIATYDGLTATLIEFLSKNGISPMSQQYSVVHIGEEAYMIDLVPSVAESFADMRYLSEKYIYPDAAVFGQTLDLENVHLE